MGTLIERMRRYYVPKRALGVVTLIREEFSGTTGTLLTAHTISPINIPGTSWTYVGGYTNSLKLSSNQLTGMVYANTLDILDAGVADCTISHLYHYNSGSFCALAFRYVDYDNYWFVVLANTKILYLYSKDAGALTMVTNTGVLTVPNGDYTFKIILKGNSIHIDFGGIGIINYSSAVRKTATKHGIDNMFSTDLRDDYVITVP